MTHSPKHRRYTLTKSTPIKSWLYRNQVIILIVTVVAALVVVLGASAFAAPPKPATHAHIQKGQPTAFWMRTPCEYEDSVNCYWDAGGSGNHKGHSFYVRYVPGKAHMVCVFYTQAKFARWHDYCERDDPNFRIYHKRIDDLQQEIHDIKEKQRD